MVTHEEPLSTDNKQQMHKESRSGGPRPLQIEGRIKGICYIDQSNFHAGKYTLQNKPGGPRSGVFSDERIRRIQPLLGLLRDIGSGHDKKSPAQVALNWVICKGALPICGMSQVPAG